MKDPQEIIFTSKSGMARCMGVARSTVMEWTGKRDFPGGANGPWNLPAIVAWLIARGAKQTAVTPGDDPLLEGGESEWLEKYRKEKTLLARMERKAKRLKLLSRDQVHIALSRMASIIRGAGEQLQRQFGTEALRLLDEAMDDAEREMESLVSDSQAEESTQQSGSR